jgi:protein TonB
MVRQPETLSPPISVALLPAPSIKKPVIAARPSLPNPAPLASAPAPRAVEEAPSQAPRQTPDIRQAETPPEPSPVPDPAWKAAVRGDPVITRSSLPTLKDLLPPVTWSKNTQGLGNGEPPIPLNSRDPQYVPYLTRVKRAIELVWEYPEAALLRGIQGKLVLEFTIASDGQLREAVLVQSSGSRLLDGEAIRAVRTASPFHPIPSRMGKSQLHISASFEYFDRRVRYSPVP